MRYRIMDYRDAAQKKIIKQIRMCGQSIIDNAETIAGGYRYQTDPLSIKITIEEDGVPNITVEQNFIPEKLMRFSIF